MQLITQGIIQGLGRFAYYAAMKPSDARKILCTQLISMDTTILARYVLNATQRKPMNNLDEALLKRNQSWRDDISQGAHETMNLLGSFSPTIMVEARTVKGWLWDGDNGVNSSYFTSDDLRDDPSAWSWEQDEDCRGSVSRRIT